MGARFSNGCAATYVFIMKHPTGQNSDVRSNSYRYIKSVESTKSGSDLDPEEAVAALHHCLGETEVFVLHLQEAIKANSIHIKGKKKRKKKKHKPNSSYITPSLPPEIELVNAFKRIKLAINYVARLKPYLYNPNGPELIRILFGHLAVLVNACNILSPPYNSSIPSRVILPLLSRDSIKLLRNCLVSKEIDLWKTMGKAWILPRDEWKGEGSLCNAVLLEGWEACYPPNGSVVDLQPWSTRSRHRSSEYSNPSIYTESGTVISDGSASLNTFSNSIYSPL